MEDSDRIAPPADTRNYRFRKSSLLLHDLFPCFFSYHALKVPDHCWVGMRTHNRPKKIVRKQIMQQEGRLPKAVVACVGGGSNSNGIFHSFLHDLDVDLYGVEAGGESLSPGQNAAPLVAGREGVLHGMMTYVLQDEVGQVKTTRSISAGLDYPGVGPEHAFLMTAGRAKYVTVSDAEVLDAFKNLSQLEGIMPALESAHAIS